MEGISRQEKNVADKNKYLNEGIKPIFVCIESSADRPSDYHGLNHIEPVNLYGDAQMMKEMGYIKEGIDAWVISPIENSNFSSNEFANCTGAVVVGSEIEAGENIAFMSHQNPDYFLKDKKDKFIADFQQRLGDMGKRCARGTIDAVLFSGRFAHVKEYKQLGLERSMFIQEYVDSIKLLSEQIYETLGFHPEVIVGPKLSPAYDTVTFDTQNRRLYLTRHDKKPTDFVQSFNAKDIETVSKTWKPGEWGLPI
jgi:hypothetical protein